ncbi:cytochrome c oxidase subunit I [Actinomadura decatromicini]|uniref:Cytochrome c oxidase subunit 1 n=1 Tax=Actinomadura decatromicini TaxID=2604572 RepID=A0A5D3FHU5_9ACTN|nr:cytochrome c oxidase subunit I [Actinomadura decatromicini]TYK47709.1 cytochrome c oxidase subunit I [Actinomadura decatromicini]
MTAVRDETDTSTADALARHRKGTRIGDVLATTDHKVVGYLYLATSFAMFLIAGLMAMLMRAELLEPGTQLMGAERYNELFTVHGTIMMLLFATPLFAGFANVIVPLQIGAPDVAFPRLNTLSYYLFLFGALLVLAGFLMPEGAASFGWFAYSPLTSATFSPGHGKDLWVMGLILSGVSTTLTGVNMIATIVAMRAPGMVMFRLPIFCWNVLLTALMIIIAFPVLAAALFALEADRRLGAHIYDGATGGALLWQHLFWFFGHPEVYIVAVPFFGIVTEIIPVFARKPLFGYLGMVAATIAISGLSMTVWAHHMFATGQVLLPFFSITSFMIAVPTGIKFFNWVGTLWKGQLSFETPMLFALGFLTTFLFGGLTGVILASPALDFHLTDSFFVVGHLHYVLFGTVVFAMFGGFYFWWPKMTGKMLNETWGKIHFWTLFVGFHTTFLVQHWLGAEGMPRRYADYPDQFATLNFVASVGSFVLGASTFAFLWNVLLTWRRGERVSVDDPWGAGGSLEWATSCPPPRHNFTSMPRIRSLRPAFDLHYPPKQSPEQAELALPD